MKLRLSASIASTRRWRGCGNDRPRRGRAATTGAEVAPDAGQARRPLRRRRHADRSRPAPDRYRQGGARPSGGRRSRVSSATSRPIAASTADRTRRSTTFRPTTTPSSRAGFRLPPCDSFRGRWARTCRRWAGPRPTSRSATSTAPGLSCCRSPSRAAPAGRSTSGWASPTRRAGSPTRESPAGTAGCWPRASCVSATNSTRSSGPAAPVTVAGRSGAPSRRTGRDPPISSAWLSIPGLAVDWCRRLQERAEVARQGRRGFQRNRDKRQ